jgi:hypothetical protein
MCRTPIATRPCWTTSRGGNDQPSPKEKIILPERQGDLRQCWKIRTLPSVQRDEFLLCASKIAVGPLIAERPPHRSERAQFGHSALALGGLTPSHRAWDEDELHPLQGDVPYAFQRL